MVREKSLDNKLKVYLQSYGAWCIKYWAGAKFTKDGIPDFLCCIDGCFFGIEDKAASGSPTLLQLYNLRKIREAGGYGILLYPDQFEYFKKFLIKKDKNDPWYLGNIEFQDVWKKKLEK